LEKKWELQPKTCHGIWVPTGWKAKLHVEAGRAAWTGATKKTRMGNSRYKEVGEGLFLELNLPKNGRNW